MQMQESKMTYLGPTYLGPEAHGDQMLWMSGEIVQPVKLVDHLIRVFPPMLNYVIQQR